MAVKAQTQVEARAEVQSTYFAEWLDRFLFYGSVALGFLLNLAFALIFLVVEPDFIQTPERQVVSVLKIFWITHTIIAAANLGGILLYGSPARRNRRNVEQYSGWNPSKLLVVAYVSRGNNWMALQRAITKTAAILKDMNVRYLIEVVTDIPVADKLKPTDHIHFVVVPSDYRPPNGTKYKARALHYLAEERADRLPASPNIWVLHLDEESYVVDETVAGIHVFINDPDNVARIGQGEILYNGHNYGSNVLIAATDAQRTGEDLGRYRLQYRFFHRPSFGIHGSYILIPSQFERDVGFDLGLQSSLAEDAYFALVAADRGARFGWVDGAVREQSPFTIKDLIRQRVRWLHGLSMLIREPEVSVGTRLMLFICVWLWRISWCGHVVTILNVFAGGSYLPPLMITLVVLVGGGTWTIYLIGMYRNLLMYDGELSKLRRVLLYFSPIVLMPFINVIEGAAVVYGSLTKPKGFHIVNKN